MVMSQMVALSWRNEKGAPETCGPSIRSLISFGGMMSSACPPRDVARPPDVSNATSSSFDLMVNDLESGRADARPRIVRTPAIVNPELNEYILEDFRFPVKHALTRWWRWARKRRATPGDLPGAVIG